MEKELLEHNLRLLEKKLRESGFPEESVLTVRDRVRAGKDGHFMVAYTVEFDGAKATGEYVVARESADKPYRLAGFSMDLGGEGRGLVAPMNYMLFQPSGREEVTLREAFNLMHGRAIFRERVGDGAGRFWVTLDPEQLVGRTVFQYDRADRRAEEMVAESVLARFLGQEQLVELAESLKQGDRKEVTVSVFGVPRQVWVEVAPERRSLKVRDDKGRQVNLPELNRRFEREDEELSVGKARGRRR